MDRTRTITVGSVAAVLLAAALALATTTGLVGADRSSSGTPDSVATGHERRRRRRRARHPGGRGGRGRPDDGPRRPAGRRGPRQRGTDRPVAPAPVRAEDDDD